MYNSKWDVLDFIEFLRFNKTDTSCRCALIRCTLHPNDSLAMEGPLSRVKSLKKSLRQSFRRIRKSRVSGKKRTITTPTSKVSEVFDASIRNTLAFACLNCARVRLVVRRSGPRGQCCFSRTGGRGSGAAKDRTSLRRRLPVRRRPVPLLCRHLFA